MPRVEEESTFKSEKYKDLLKHLKQVSGVKAKVMAVKEMLEDLQQYQPSTRVSSLAQRGKQEQEQEHWRVFKNNKTEAQCWVWGTHRKTTLKITKLNVSLLTPVLCGRVGKTHFKILCYAGGRGSSSGTVKKKYIYIINNLKTSEGHDSKGPIHVAKDENPALFQDLGDFPCFKYGPGRLLGLSTKRQTERKDFCISLWTLSRRPWAHAP